MDDKRREPRLNIRLEVELHAEGDTASLHTRDLSNKGAFLEASERALPAVGTIVFIKLKQGFQDGDVYGRYPAQHGRIGGQQAQIQVDGRMPAAVELEVAEAHGADVMQGDDDGL